MNEYIKKYNDYCSLDLYNLALAHKEQGGGIVYSSLMEILKTRKEYDLLHSIRINY